MEYIQFNLLKPYSTICHGIFTRNQGFSKKPFNSLNVSLNIGDDKNLVFKNRKKILQFMKFKKSFYLNQVHGKEIFILKKDNYLKNQKIDINNRVGDGIVTNIPEILLVIQTADCQSILMYDPLKKVIANIHSGWQGSIQNIIKAGIDTMINCFQCKPENILSCIGPSLGPCCCEFINYKTEIPKNLWKYKLKNNYFDFWKLSFDQLILQGVKSHNIEIKKKCTKCSTKDFFSYRKEKITGRFASVLGIKK
ncbi:MAG: hypothetical protein B6I26_03330 [Desulfobacteraceae bacterium 4572_130]|nr:MAG: hypothetical protein B6I26_03330 [Desulfobacteraceae bacterium 4572_130]